MKSVGRRLAVGLVLCLCLSLVLTACSGEGEQVTPEAKDTLTVILSADPAHLDANHSDSQTHYQAVRQIYETLFVYDDNYNIQPWLCESYRYEDDTTIILNLRKGVKFHNGDELKASDVLFTARRAVEQNLSGKIEFEALDLDKCEALDDYKVKLVTKGPSATLIPLLENPAASIISERAYKEANGDFLNGACVGTGPFKFVSYSPGDQLVLEAFEDYWREGEPHVKKLILRFVGDPSSRAIEAETGGADIVYDIGAKDIARVNAAPGVKVVSDLGTNTSYLLFNTARKPLDDIRVRQAIWYAVDAEAAVKLAYGDFGAFAQGWLSPGINGDDPTQVEKYWPKRDLEKAKQLLAEAGYADGLELTIAVANNNQERCDMAEAFQGQLAEVGITLKLDVMEASTWNTHILDGKHDLTIYGMSASDFEADRALVQYMPSHVNYNLCAYDNPEFQRKVNEAAVTLDNEARFQLYRDAQNMLLEDYVTLPLWHKELNAAVRDGIEGFKITRSYEHHYLQYVRFAD